MGRRSPAGALRGANWTDAHDFAAAVIARLFEDLASLSESASYCMSAEARICGLALCASLTGNISTMRLQRLELMNFRGFAERSVTFHPEFNLLIGVNGTGKTSLLEAAAVALGAWLQGFPDTDTRNIRARDVRRVEDESGGRLRLLPKYPVRVSAEALLPRLHSAASPDSELKLRWTRTLEGSGGRTTQAGARQLKDTAASVAREVRDGVRVTLPIIRYFGAGRLWESVRASEKRRGRAAVQQMGEADEDPDAAVAGKFSDPFYGYRMSVDKRANPQDFIRWIGQERRNEIDLERPSDALRLVYKAILTMLPELEAVRFELRRNSLMLQSRDGVSTRFEDMSDGYRNTIAMAADLAIKVTMLNPHLGLDALALTPGVVLIDELDLHLHPTWQRRIADNLRNTFPNVQFICSSHSPFIVQSLRSGEELIVLDGQPTGDTFNMTLEEVAEGLMRVDHAEVSGRYKEMKDTARRLLEEMEKHDLSDEAKFERFQRRLADGTSPFADNPAYQAFLEMKLAKHAPSDPQ